MCCAVADTPCCSLNARRRQPGGPCQRCYGRYFSLQCLAGSCSRDAFPLCFAGNTPIITAHVHKCTQAPPALTPLSCARSILDSSSTHSITTPSAAPHSAPPPLSDKEIEEASLVELQHVLDQTLCHRATQPCDTAYYIHTSGSTGKPKCVVHVHSSLDWHSHVTLLGSGVTRSDDVCLQVADCSFDLHIRDIFCFISTGGHVVSIPPAALTDMRLLCSLFLRHR